MNKAFFSAMSVATAALLPSAVFAQVNSPAVGAPAAAGAVLGVMIFFGFFILIALALFVFWIMMIVDCLKRDWPDKNLWLILLVVSFFFGLNWLTAILYYFIVKKPNLGPVASATQPPPTQPPTTPTAPPAA